ncbi:hypothetical protein AGMMS49944_08160 [Spirochaetia bacterium]|nr:hypothetical protein AGMMS49944_08160 [Spirochaetia bacterium]
MILIDYPLNSSDIYIVKNWLAQNNIEAGDIEVFTSLLSKGETIEKALEIVHELWITSCDIMVRYCKVGTLMGGASGSGL